MYRECATRVNFRCLTICTIIVDCNVTLHHCDTKKFFPDLFWEYIVWVLRKLLSFTKLIISLCKNYTLFALKKPPVSMIFCTRKKLLKFLTPGEPLSWYSIKFLFSVYFRVHSILRMNTIHNGNIHDKIIPIMMILLWSSWQTIFTIASD